MHGLIAQRNLEHALDKREVGGSNPPRPTILSDPWVANQSPLVRRAAGLPCPLLLGAQHDHQPLHADDLPQVALDQMQHV